jgi:hypothetical protein
LNAVKEGFRCSTSPIYADLMAPFVLGNAHSVTRDKLSLRRKRASLFFMKTTEAPAPATSLFEGISVRRKASIGNSTIEALI